ncbi:hypothetical protein OC844_002987 [Tilletia horrida]|nr:hypothetical protein OC844_002987 [Tilletia horrida]
MYARSPVCTTSSHVESIALTTVAVEQVELSSSLHSFHSRASLCPVFHGSFDAQSRAATRHASGNVGLNTLDDDEDNVDDYNRRSYKIGLEASLHRARLPRSIKTFGGASIIKISFLLLRLWRRIKPGKCADTSR